MTTILTSVVYWLELPIPRHIRRTYVSKGNTDVAFSPSGMSSYVIKNVVGTHREWTVTDDCGLSSSLVQNFYIQELLNPVYPAIGQQNIDLQERLQWPNYLCEFTLQECCKKNSSDFDVHLKCNRSFLHACWCCCFSCGDIRGLRVEFWQPPTCGSSRNYIVTILRARAAPTRQHTNLVANHLRQH